MRRITCSLLFACLILSVVRDGHAALTPEARCHSARAKAWAKYESCIYGVLSRAYSGSEFDVQAKFSRCRETFVSLWPRLASLEGSPCDRERFEDNGDETVTDHLTGRIWAKKRDDGSIHDRNNLYSWTVGDDFDYENEDGTIFTEYLYFLNDTHFAGATGWRLPTLPETLSLLSAPYPCAQTPCVDATLQSYWEVFHKTSTSDPTNDGQRVWAVDLGTGECSAGGKASDGPVNAVRAGF